MPAHNEQLLANVSILLIAYCLGRRFNIGTIKGEDVIYVMTGEQTVGFHLSFIVFFNTTTINTYYIYLM